MEPTGARGTGEKEKKAVTLQMAADQRTLVIRSDRARPEWSGPGPVLRYHILRAIVNIRDELLFQDDAAAGKAGTVG
jgi:hypothetical protein